MLGNLINSSRSIEKLINEVKIWGCSADFCIKVHAEFKIPQDYATRISKILLYRPAGIADTVEWV